MKYADRIEQVKTVLAEREQDAFIVSGAHNAFYFSGLHMDPEGDYPIVLIPQDGEPLVLISRRDENQALGQAVIPFDMPEGRFSEAIVERVDGPNVLVDGQMTTKLYTTLNKELNLTVEDELLMDIRSRKDDSELEQMRAAYRITEAVLESQLESLDQGDTENHIAARLEYEFRRNGASGAAFNSIVASGANAAIAHHRPGDDPIEGTCLFDIGARNSGYCADLSRTVAFGTASSEFIDAYETVRQAQHAAAKQLSPGSSTKSVDATAREVIEENGYDSHPHGTGHGLGIAVHEKPVLSPQTDTELVAGNVVTIEPGIYVNGEFGIRIEDAYVITANGAERLSSSTRELVQL